MQIFTFWQSCLVISLSPEVVGTNASKIAELLENYSLP